MAGVVVVTMAGRSSRFSASGVTVPKWALEVGGVSLLERSLWSCLPLLSAGFRLRLVALAEHAALIAPLVGRSGLECEVVLVDAVPDGQARSASAGLEGVEGGTPVAVWNVDTQLLPEAFLPAWPSEGDWLLLSELEGDCWSFARLSGDRVVATAEKERISGFASVGMYGFSSADLLRDLVASAPSGGGELFVAPLYNRLVAAGSSVRGVVVPSGSVVPFGTPTQLLSSCRRLGVAPPPELAG